MAAPRKRLSLTRLLILVLAIVGLAAVGWSQANQAYERLTAKPPVTWFGPYTDVTLTPTHHFEDSIVSPSLTQVLGFVVADPREPCTPTWGTYYDLDGAGRALDLDRRITRLRERGGDAIISFGGAANAELALSCTDQDALTAAYRAVIDRYDARIVDFDIEGTALADVAANTRRAIAIAQLARDAADDGHPLRVWLTVPVSPAGMPREAVALLSTTLQHGVKLAGVNVMTMDYGASRIAGVSMRTANERALRATWRQVNGAYRRAGQPLTASQVWARIGATPMIGRNDVPGEVFTLGDARALIGLANGVGLGRVSMWSANRDVQCGVQAGPQVSNTCSGVSQRPLAFTWELSRLNARLPGRVRVRERPEPVRAASRDNPETSPYPIWRPRRSYTGGEKVVWHARVYEAKWWTQASVPDAPVKHLWDTPWRYVGPVLPSDSHIRPPSLRPWSAEQVYLEGDRVVYHASIYRAKWWTQADLPAADDDGAGASPWTLVGKVPTVKQAATEKNVAPVKPAVPDKKAATGKKAAPGKTAKKAGTNKAKKKP